MATILEIIQSFCYRINQPAPSAIVGVTTPAERQYLELFRSIGDNLRNRPYQWPQLKRGYVFTTATGVARYQLPGDFYRLLTAAQWDIANTQAMIGPVSDSRMAANQLGVIDTQTQKLFRIIGPTSHLVSTSPYSKRSAGVFEIEQPGANDTDTMYMGYLSCNWIWPRDWVASTAYSAGDIRSVDGYVYICKTSGTSGTTRPSTGTVDTDITDNSAVWRVYNEPYLAVAANSKLNDADLCLFDDDLMIEGMRWAYYQAKKLDYQQERADWENQVRSSYARFQGPVRINLAESDDATDLINIPAGSWSV